MKRLRRLEGLLSHPEVWVLTLGALLTRLWQLGLPPAVVFDEIYFRQFAADYLTGNYFFDVHPPLVKLLLAGLAGLAHLAPQQIVDADPAATTLRYLPALAGVLLVPLMYLVLRQLRLGRRVATLGASLVLLDNALLVESRFILTDSFLLLAGLGALSGYLALRRRSGNRRWVWVAVTAICIGAMVTTKWTGLATAGVIGLAWLIEGVLHKADWRRMLGEGALGLLVVALIYIGSFMVHFTLLTHSGEGDPFMSQKFQSTLTDSPAYDKSARMSLWDKFIELNAKMYSAQDSLSGVQHPYASKWYSWPLEARPVYFWQGNTLRGGTQGNIYLLGNPLVWLVALFGTLASLMIWLVRPLWLGARRKLVAFLLVGYAVNFVPFMFIDRPMFLYHYLFALLFSIILASVMIGVFFDWQASRYGRKAVRQTTWVFIGALVLSFLYFVPLSYGLPLSPSDLQQRMWLPTWR